MAKNSDNGKKGKDVVKTGGANQEVATINYAQDAGRGSEGMTTADYAIPFIGILQSNSPQVDDDSGKYLKGAKKGMFINTVTNELFDGDKGIIFIPCARSHMVVEWIPRDDGGGFVAQHEVTADVVLEARKKADTQFGKLKAANGNDLVETFYVFGIQVLPDGRLEQAMLAFASTQIKKYKQWMTIYRNIIMTDGSGKSFNPAIYTHQYKLTTQAEENKKGKFIGWRIVFAGGEASKSLVTDPKLYQTCKIFHEMCGKGKVQADYRGAERETATGAGDDAGDNI
jgi:hypothetical protein